MELELTWYTKLGEDGQNTNPYLHVNIPWLFRSEEAGLMPFHEPMEAWISRGRLYRSWVAKNLVAFMANITGIF